MLAMEISLYRVQTQWLKRLLVIGVGYFALTGCGVRQFNAKNPTTTSTPRLTAGYGPFYASGQGSGAMSTATCGSLAGRPCARARVSVGMPFQYDTNNSTSGAVGTVGGAVTDPGPAGPLASSAAGTTTYTGTATISDSSTTVTGAGTLFLTELKAGGHIKVNGENRVIASITSNTLLTVDRAFSASGAGHAIERDNYTHAYANGPYATSAGAGKVKDSGGQKAMENRDLKMFKRQVATGEQVF